MSTPETTVLRVNVEGNALEVLDKIAATLDEVAKSAKRADDAMEKVDGGGLSGPEANAVGQELIAWAGGLEKLTELSFAAVAAVREFVKEGVLAVIADTPKAQAAVDSLTVSFDNLQIAVGEALVGSGDSAVVTLGEVQASVDYVTRTVRESGDQFDESFGGAIKTLKIIAAVLVSTTSLALTPLAVAIDVVVGAVTLAIKIFLGFRVVVLKAAESVGELLHQLGVLSTEGMVALRKITKDANDEMRGFEVRTAGLSKGLFNLNKVVWGAATAQRDHNKALSSGEKILADFNKGLNEQLAQRAMLDNLTPQEIDRLRLIGEATRKLTEANEAQVKYLKGEVEETKKANALKDESAAAINKIGDALKRVADLQDQIRAATEGLDKGLLAGASVYEGEESVLGGDTIAQRVTALAEARDRALAKLQEFDQTGAGTTGSDGANTVLDKLFGSEEWITSKQAAWESFNSTLWDAGDSLAYLVGQFAAGEVGVKDFGKALLEQFVGVANNVADIGLELGKLVFAASTGWGIGIIAASYGLKAILGSLGGIGGGSGSRSSSSAAPLRALREAFVGGREESEGDNITVIANFDSNHLEPTIVKVVRDAANRGRLRGAEFGGVRA